MFAFLNSWIHTQIEKRLGFNQGERVKLIFLSLSFFLIIGSYSILRSLKTSIFLGFVGKEYLPYTRLITIILIIPCLLAYAKLVDKVKRHQIVYVILSVYAILGFIFMALLAHPTIGINNSMTSPYRIVGWAFEIYMDLYSALVVSTFWGFINSACTTNFAGKSYGVIVATSRIGGIITPLLALLITRKSGLSTGISIPLLVFIGSFLLLAAIAGIHFIIKNVPEKDLRGYEASYQEEIDILEEKKKPGLLGGLKIMLKEPYVLGIFGLVYCMEVISILFEYQWQVLLSLQTNNHVGEMSSFMFLYTASFQMLAFVFAFFGVSTLLAKIGIRSCLLIMPIATIFLALGFILLPKLATIFIVLVALRALNYGFNQPTREILYIPTTKEVQFKSKSWIESFGKTFSKASGSILTIFSIMQSPINCLYTNSIFSLTFSFGYLFIAFFIGKRYNATIQNNRVIGKDL